MSQYHGIKYTVPIIVFLALALVTAAGCGQAHGWQLAWNSAMHITSPAFAAGGHVPMRFSCQGKGISPPLHWAGVPASATTLALIVDDPDAPGGTWVHWLVYNLPADGHGLVANASANGLSAAAQTGSNSWHKSGYGGMCPPDGMHHYRFKLYALDTRLDLDDPTKIQLLAAMQGHVVARAKLTAIYTKR